jgi:hypothetical protein
MRKIAVMILLVLSTTFIFASSAELVEKINKRVENLKQELNGELGKNGISYQVAGSFTVEENSIKIEAYVVPNAGEQLLNKFSITELRERRNLENLIKRESNFPKSESPVSSRGVMETLAFLITAAMFVFMFKSVYSRRREKKIKNSIVAETEKTEDKKAA